MRNVSYGVSRIAALTGPPPVTTLAQYCGRNALGGSLLPMMPSILWNASSNSLRVCERHYSASGSNFDIYNPSHCALVPAFGLTPMLRG